MVTVNQTMLVLQKIREDVTDLQRDMAKVGILVDRLDITIDKLSEFSGNVSKLIAIHETKLEFHEKQNADLLYEIKSLRTDSTNQHDALSKRITIMERWMWLVVGGSIVGGFIINALIKLA